MSHNPHHSTAVATWLWKMLSFRRECDEELAGQTGWQVFLCKTVVFFSSQVAKDTPSYLSTVILSCKVALWVEVWDISLLFDEWRVCLIVSLWTPSDWHNPDPCLQLFHLHKPRLASAALPSQRRQYEESARDSRTERAVWMGLLVSSMQCTVGSRLITASGSVSIISCTG